MERSVVLAQPKFHLEWLSGGDRVRPLSHHFQEVVRMVGGLPTPADRIFKALTGVFVPALAVPIDPSVGAARPDDDGDRLGERAELIFGSVHFSNVEHDAEPSSGESIAVQLGLRADPPIRPVATPYTRVNAKRFTGPERLCVGRGGALAILRMDERGPPLSYDRRTRPARHLFPPVIGKLDRAVGAGGPNDDRQRLHGLDPLRIERARRVSQRGRLHARARESLLVELAGNN